MSRQQVECDGAGRAAYSRQSQKEVWSNSRLGGEALEPRSLWPRKNRDRSGPSAPCFVWQVWYRWQEAACARDMFEGPEKEVRAPSKL